jgi:hypothetical protein
LFRTKAEAEDLSFEDLPSAVENIGKYDSFDWKKEKPLCPFDKRRGRKSEVSGLLDSLNPDVSDELNSAQIAEVLGDDVEAPIKKNSGKTAQ